jgi:hypothetical protein
MRKLLIAVVALLCVSALPAPDQSKLAIHEWGTFTSLQDEAGRSIGNLNADSQPLPAFVHTLRPGQRAVEGKGAPISPNVTMRLETPVLYFHLPGDVRSMKITVRESFRGGWLTQYFPDAVADARGIDSNNLLLAGDTMGSLTWKNLELGAQSAGPKTDSAIWLAPRKVDAANVRTAAGESERFLFDRGVGHIEAPLKITRVGDNLEIRSQIDKSVPMTHGRLKITKLWLLDVNSLQLRAYRSIDGFTVDIDPSKLLATIPANFTDAEHNVPLQPLLDSMHAELVHAGLNGDEADAMLNTWRSAYFDSQGLRVFFIAPRDWTDHYLPLETSVPADLTRVMVARIELVTPEYRALANHVIKNPRDYAAQLTFGGWRFGAPLLQAMSAGK